MQASHRHFSSTKAIYDRNLASPLSHLAELVQYSIGKLKTEAVLKLQGHVGNKLYSVFMVDTVSSRPILPSFYNSDPAVFAKEWNDLVQSASPKDRRFLCRPDEANRVLYTSIMAFCGCYDLWKSSSRKTPGTFFEVLMGSLLSLVLPDFVRTKQIPLSVGNGSLSTDLVFGVRGRPGGLVLPVKITTRERIVQPFAHQRILDSVFGTGVIDRFCWRQANFSGTKTTASKKFVSRERSACFNSISPRWPGCVISIHHCDIAKPTSRGFYPFKPSVNCLPSLCRR